MSESRRRPERGGLDMFKTFLDARKPSPHMKQYVEPDPKGLPVKLFEGFQAKADPHQFGAYEGYWRQVLIGDPSWQHPAFQVLSWTHPHSINPGVKMPKLHDFALGVGHSMFENSNWLVPPTRLTESTANAIGTGSFPIAVGRGTHDKERAFPSGGMHAYQPIIDDDKLSCRMGTLRFHEDGSIDVRSLAHGVCFEANVYFKNRFS